MADNYMVRLYPQYLSDKAEITRFLDTQKISPGETSALSDSLALCERWSHLPFFRRRLEPYHLQLVALREKTSGSKRDAGSPGGLTTVFLDNNLLDTSFLNPTKPNSIEPNLIELSPIEPRGGKAKEAVGKKELSDNYDFSATPEKIHRFFENQGIIGEQGNQEILVYGALARANLGIESLSGSGKSALLYALLEALPKERYKVIHQATGKSLFQDQDASGLDFWVIPELQKVFNPEIEEIVKNLTEGVSATHTRTNSSKTGIDFLEIKKKAVLYSFAVTNRHGKKRDEEFYRRFIILHTDISTRQTLEVALRYAERDFACGEECGEDNLFRSHLAGCLSSVQNVRNPFLDYIIRSLPEEISSPLRFRSAVKYFQSLVKGKTLYSSAGPERISSKLFSTLEDNQRVISLYAQTLFENIHSVSVVEKAILNLVQEKELSPEGLNWEFKEKYGELPLFNESLERLQGKGFVGRENGALKAIPWPKIQVDPEEAIFAADILMQKEFPKYRDHWYQKNMELLR